MTSWQSSPRATLHALVNIRLPSITRQPPWADSTFTGETTFFPLTM